MRTADRRIGYEDIQVISPYQIQKLSDLTISNKVNEHAKLLLTGIVPEEKRDQYMEMAKSTDTIEVKQLKEGLEVRTLFRGLVSDIGIRSVRGIYYLEIEALSHTITLDVKRKSRSFQHKEMIYPQLLDQILKDYPGADFIDHASESSELGTIAMQYQETDWQFMKRMASRFGAVLVPDATAPQPKFWFGMAEGRPGELQNTHYQVSKNLADFLTTTQNGYATSLPVDAFRCYEVESESYLSLGDRVTFQGQELLVAESTAAMKQGTFLFTHVLAPKEGIRQNQIVNPLLSGAALEGKIIEVAKDTVRIHLDIDEKQEKSKANWFPYSSFYTAEGNSGFYCMPQLGDAVKLYFPNSKEEEATAISSVRKGGASSPKTANPGIKYWGTNFGKEMMMGGKDLSFTAKEGSVFLSLHEDQGIMFQSEFPIVVATEQNLELQADKKIKITAQEAVYLVCDTSSVMLDGETHLQAPMIKMEGTYKAPVVVEDLPEEAVEEEVVEEEESNSFLDNLQLGLDIVGLIPGLGEVADLANGVISLARGDFAGAVLSFAAMIPFAGWGATAAKVGIKAAKAAKKVKTVAKVVDKGAQLAKAVKKVKGVTKGKVLTSARKAKRVEKKIADAVDSMKSSMKKQTAKLKKLNTPGKAKVKSVTKKQSKNLSQKNPRTFTKKSCKNDPIHAGSGAQFVVHQAMQLYGASTWSFELHYNSMLLQQGSMGKAWTHNYEMKLAFPDEHREEITVWWNTGRSNQFKHVQNGLYRSEDHDVYYDELREYTDHYVLFCKGSRETYHFRRNGQLFRHTNALGQSLLCSYDQHQRLSKLTDQLSKRSLMLDYTESGLLRRIHDDSRSIRFSYNDAKQLVHFTDPKGIVSDLHYTSNGQLESLAVAGVIQYVNTFDEDGRIIRQTNPAGEYSQFDYDEETLPGKVITTVTNSSGTQEVLIHDENMLLIENRTKDGGIERFTYNEQGQLLSETSVGGEVTSYTYDDRGNLIEIVDPLGNKIIYEFNEHDLLIRETNAEGGISTYEYNEDGQLICLTRPDELRARLEYNERGQRISYTDFTGAVTRYLYDDNGLLYAALDPEGRQIRVYYDEIGRMTAFEDSRKGRVLRTYDANDNLLQVIDPLGRVYSYEYDDWDQRVREQTPSGASTSYTYNQTGTIDSVTDALGNVTKFVYDKEDQIVARIDPNGAITHFERDAMGRIVGVTDPLGREQRFVYDVSGRLTEVWDAQGQKVSSHSYDAAGNLLAQTDALGRTTKLSFNALHQCISTQNALGQKTSFAYDAASRLTEVLENDAAVYKQRYDGEGRLVSYTDANENETTRRYDRSGLLLEERNATGESTTYNYDERGWLKQKTNARGQETNYQFDTAGQLLKVKDEVSTVQMGYDAEGRVVRIAEEGSGEKSRVYDLLGRVVSSTDSFGNTIGYAYDEAGRLTKLIYPDGKEVTYTYDLTGQLTRVEDWAGRVTTHEYDANGQLIRTERTNGTIEQRAYDEAGQLVKLWDTTSQGIMLQQYRYVYNEIGQIIQEEEKQYTYDALRRLTSGAWPGRKVWYLYDQAGNITEIGEVGNKPTKEMSYSKDNRLLTVDGSPVTFDEDGNLLSVSENGQLEEYKYDARNRLVRTSKTTYTYDAENIRTALIWNGKTTRYVVDPTDELSRVLMELDESGKPKAYYVYGLGLIGREDANGKYLSYHYDKRGSTTILTDEKGIVTDRYSYGVYGELEHHEGTTHQPFCYNGRDGVMTDPNGLYYMRARYYHPGLKRFLNRDILQGEITDGQTFNRFAYVNGDPVQFIDPLGLMKKCETRKIIVDRHGNLKKNKSIPGQSHHLNQDAAYRDIIPTNDGKATKLEGNAFKDVNSPHYNAHESLEEFWDQYRRGGAKDGDIPTNLEYTKALMNSLKATGKFTDSEVKYIVREAIKQRVEFGLLSGLPVPRIPGRINQKPRF